MNTALRLLATLIGLFIAALGWRLHQPWLYLLTCVIVVLAFVWLGPRNP